MRLRDALDSAQVTQALSQHLSLFDFIVALEALCPGSEDDYLFVHCASFLAVLRRRTLVCKLTHQL